MHGCCTVFISCCTGIDDMHTAVKARWVSRFQECSQDIIAVMSKINVSGLHQCGLVARISAPSFPHGHIRVPSFPHEHMSSLTLLCTRSQSHSKTPFPFYVHPHAQYGRYCGGDSTAVPEQVETANRVVIVLHLHKQWPSRLRRSCLALCPCMALLVGWTR